MRDVLQRAGIWIGFSGLVRGRAELTGLSLFYLSPKPPLLHNNVCMIQSRNVAVQGGLGAGEPSSATSVRLFLASVSPLARLSRYLSISPCVGPDTICTRQRKGNAVELAPGHKGNAEHSKELLVPKSSSSSLSAPQSFSSGLNPVFNQLLQLGLSSEEFGDIFSGWGKALDITFNELYTGWPNPYPEG